MVSVEKLGNKYDVQELKDMIAEHVAYTNSAKGKEILDHFEEYLPKFKKIIPHDYKQYDDGDRADGRKRSEQ